MSNIETSNDLIRLKESFVKAFDSRIEAQKLQERVAELDNLNFGDMKALFEGVSNKLFDGAKDCVAKYIKTIKENKDLKTLYVLYENAIKPAHTNDANLLVSSMVAISEGIDKKSLKEGLKKLNAIVKESVLKAGVSVDEVNEILSKNASINESLSFILTNSKNAKNLFEHTNKVHDVVNYINENMSSTSDENVESKTSEELVSELNEAISCNNTWETEAIKDLTLCYLSDSNGEELFEQYKNDCISLLNEKIESTDNIEEGIRFSTMKESLENKKYDKEKIKESILKLAELRYTLGE